jgi:hypothetical protein
VQDRQRERSGFAGTGLSDPDDVAPRHDNRDGLGLDRGWGGVLFFRDRTRNRFVKAEAIERGQ